MITIDSYIYIEAARLYRVSLLPGASIGERLLLLLLLPFEVLPDAFDECVVNRVCQSCVRMCVCVFVHVEQPGPKRLSMLITLKNVSSNFGNFRLFRVVGTLVVLLYGMFFVQR